MQAQDLNLEPDIFIQHKVIGVIGTDTEVGKTYVTVELLKYLNGFGFKTCGLKPIASGACHVGKQLVNDDALQLQKAASEEYHYNLINPEVFVPAIAPHIAADLAGKSLTCKRLVTSIRKSLAATKADITLVEGAGGLLTPLNMTETYADVFKALELPLILVIGMRLGCLNQALLTAAYLKTHGFNCLGWIANIIDPEMPYLNANIATLEEMMCFPKLAVFEHKAMSSVSLLSDF